MKQTIVIYLRDPLSYAASALQQRKMSGLKDVRMLRSPDYKKRLEKFCKVYGDSIVTPKEFDRDIMSNGDVVADFDEFLEIPLPKLGFKNQNESMSLEAVKLLITFSSHCQVLNGDGLTNNAMIVFRALIVNKFANGQKKTKHDFSPSLTNRVLSILRRSLGSNSLSPKALKLEL